MATTPYSETQKVSPDATPPSDYQNIQATPGAFGAQIGQGEQQLGAGASKAGQFFGEVQTDDVTNQAMTNINKRLSDFRALRGQDALNARPGVEAGMDSDIKAARDMISTPEQMHQFDQNTRTYVQRYASGVITSHADQQSKEYATSVNQSSLKVALDGISANVDNPEIVENFRHDARAAAVKQVQLEGNEGDPTAVQAAIARADQAAIKTQAEVMGIRDPNKALDFVNQNKATLGDTYAPLADSLRARGDHQLGLGVGKEEYQKAMAGHQLGVAPSQGGGQPAAGAPLPGGSAAGGAPPTRASDAPAAPASAVASADPMALLRHHEGFQSGAYWDVNHYRAGYGSDTVTRADGSIEPVTAFTQVTQADAERDLQRRVGVSQNQASQAIGPDAWAQLSPQAKASLTSITYNYGHTPSDVAAAARSGDMTQLAQAIQSRGTDNGGVNAKRRAQEAANVLGKFGLSGPEAAAPGTAQTYSMPTFNAPAGPEALSGTPTSPPADPATLAPAPTVASAAPPDPAKVKADAYTSILNNPKLQDKPEAMSAALGFVSQQIQAKQIADEQNAKALKDKRDHAGDKYITLMGNGQATPDTIHQIYNDPDLKDDWQMKHTIADIVSKSVGGDGENSGLGKNYASTFQRIVAAPGDPQRISDLGQLLPMMGSGDISYKGYERLKSAFNDNKKSTESSGINSTKASMHSYGNSQLSFDGTISVLGMAPMRDPVGKKLFEAEFVPRFESAYDQWTKAGKDPYQFLTKENVDKIITSIPGARTKAQLALAKVQADPATNAQDRANPVAPPPPPPNVRPEAWSGIVASPPPQENGQPFSVGAWSHALTMLAANPTPQNQAAFDKSQFARGANAPKAADVLKTLMPPPEPPPGPDTSHFDDLIRARGTAP